jgi:hypothetical protein
MQDECARNRGYSQASREETLHMYRQSGAAKGKKRTSKNYEEILEIFF